MLQRVFLKLAINNMMAIFATIIAHNPTHASINVIYELMSFPWSMRDKIFKDFDGSDFLSNMNVSSHDGFRFR